MTSPSARSRRDLGREVLLDVGAALGLLCILAALAHALLGVTPLVFRSGSMAPAIDSGALALAVERPVADLSPGDVVSVVDADGVRVTHRLVEVTPDGLLLKGDANPAPDSQVRDVRTADVVLFSVPKAGAVLDQASGGWTLLVGGALAALSLLMVFGPRRRGAGRAEQEGSGPRRGLGSVAVGAAMVLLVGAPVVRTMAYWSDTATMTGTAATNTYFTCQGALAAANPWLYWRLDETSGATAADSSGNGRSGTYIGGTTQGATRACGRDTGRALTLNGSSGYVHSSVAGQLLPTGGLNTFTAEIWFRTTTNRGGRLIGFGLARTGASSQYDRHLYMTDAGQIVFGVYPGGFQTLTSTDAYNDGDWHQAVGQVGSGGMKLYVDGQLLATNAAITVAESYSGWWRVGYDNLGGWPDEPTSDFFAGTVDEAAVFSSALSQAQVLASYRAGR